MTQAVFNLVNLIIGVGALSIPFAMKQSGYFAVVLFVVVISIVAQTGKWIGDSMQIASRKVRRSQLDPAFADCNWDFTLLAQICFGPRGGALIAAVTVAEVWFALVAFLAMGGANAALLWPGVNERLSMGVMGFCAVAACFAPARASAYLSLISSVAMFVAAAALVACTWMMSAWANPYDHIGQLALFQPNNIPRSVGIIVFCFAGHPCFPAVNANMREPTKWGRSINFSFLLAFVFYAGFGVLGYLVFGAELDQTVTNNLSQIRGARFYRMLAAGCFLLKIQLTMPLLLNAVMAALWNPSGASKWPPLRVVLLAAVTGFTTLTAVAAADGIAVIASLAGSLLTMTTSVLFPALLHWRLSGQERGHGSAELALHGFVLSFGSIMAVLGTGLAIQDLCA